MRTMESETCLRFSEDKSGDRWDVIVFSRIREDKLQRAPKSNYFL